MELRNLEYFVAVADEGSFTRAAARLYVTQPTVSSQIQALERELGEPLFDRLPRSIELSDGGRLLLPYARQCLAAAEDAKAEFSARSGLVRGELRLGTGGGVENGAVPATLGAFHEKHPGVDVELVEATSAPLVDLVLSGRLHAAVVAETRQPLPAGLASATMFTDQLVAVFDPAYFAFHGAAVTLTEIARQPLITYPSTSALRATLDACADDGSVPLNVRFVANDVRLQIALVRQGIGVAVSARSDPALVGLDDLEIRPLDPAVQFSKAIIWRNDVRPGAPLRAFLDLWEVAHSRSSER